MRYTAMKALKYEIQTHLLICNLNYNPIHSNLKHLQTSFPTLPIHVSFKILPRLLKSSKIFSSPNSKQSPSLPRAPFLLPPKLDFIELSIKVSIKSRKECMQTLKEVLYFPCTQQKVDHLAPN